MPFNGSGLFNRVYNWVSDKNSGIDITASRVDTEDSGFATGLSTCLLKDGTQTVTANIPFAGFKLTGVGAGTALTDVANVGQLQGASYSTLGSVSGTNTITAVSSPLITSYASGQVFRIIPANTNTGATTLNIGGLGVIAIKLKTPSGLSSLVGGELVATQEYDLYYDGTQFQIDVANGTITSTIPTFGFYKISSSSLGLISTNLVIQVTGNSSAVNYIGIQNAVTGFAPIIQAIGSDTNVNLNIQSKGSGSVYLETNGGAQVQAQIIHTASATQWPTFTGSNGGAPTISTSGGDLALNSNTGHVTAPTESAGDNSTRVATTAFVTAATPFTKSFQSPAQTMTAGSGGSVAHSLGGRPKIIYAYIRCKTAELNYAIGDEVPFPIEINNFGVNAWSDGTTNIRYWIATSFRLPNATTGGDNAITYANWELFIRAYA